jgi:general L-amino acid transport system permease protein
VFSGSDGSACASPDAGACWPFVWNKLGLFMYGRYPAAARWRIDLTYVLALAALVPLMIPRVPGKLWLSVYLLVAFPLIGFVLVRGGVLGLSYVPTELWGGLFLTLLVASVGIAASFPIGILLALGRRSELPIVRWASIGFIEFVRGVPLVTVLFMASVMLPLFLPPEVTFDKLLRALIGVALFSAAYLAEVIRGGLQAIPRGQFEAADALGLSYAQKMGLVILPQALKLVIPGIVNSFISLFKDTSLVLIIGLFDLLGIVQQSISADPKWYSPQTAATGYFFAGVIFWAFCFGMSRYSAFLERRLAAGERR